MLNRILLNLKQRASSTLRTWQYQCESILAQRSRRLQQLFSFYKNTYGTRGLQRVFVIYRESLHAPWRGIMLAAVGVSSLNSRNETEQNFDWAEERISMDNFNMCLRDIDFIETLPQNEQLCALCKTKHMNYCYCSQKKCAPVYKHDGGAMISVKTDKEWEPYFSKNEYTIWRREERSSMFAYKVYARFDDITAKDLLFVQTDLNYRRHWDQTAVVLKVIEKDPAPNTNSDVIYWEMRWPKLFANRDYVYCRRFFTDDERNVIMICNRCTRHAQYPAHADKVRVTDYWSLMVIKPFKSMTEPGVHYVLTYYDDPGVSIPQSLKSWVAQKQMPDFITKMYIATKEHSFNDANSFKQLENLLKSDQSDKEYMANVGRVCFDTKTNEVLIEETQTKQEEEIQAKEENPEENDSHDQDVEIQPS